MNDDRNRTYSGPMNSTSGHPEERGTLLDTIAARGPRIIMAGTLDVLDQEVGCHRLNIPVTPTKRGLSRRLLRA